MRSNKIGWSLLLLSYLFVTNVRALTRVVIVEEFTATW